MNLLRRIIRLFRIRPEQHRDAEAHYKHASRVAEDAMQRLAVPAPGRPLRYGAPLLVAALALLAGGLFLGLPGRAEQPTQERPGSPPASGQRPRIEAVFVLDTTGSMGGLIHAARENIWAIASNMASAQPTPELHIGLVAFRDRGDEYVTRVTDLSSDLDSMYATLMGFSAAGGGDFPEAVNEALYDAVHSISWSQDPSSYQVIFLVGDAPPQMNYQDDVKYTETVRLARTRGIVVNTIQAGEHPETRRYWQEIAKLGGGAWFQVGMQGNAVSISTPYDADIARLSRQLDDTRLFYGSPQRQQELAGKAAAGDSLHQRASPQAIARRAEFNASPAGRENFLAESDLVADIKDGKVSLASVAAEHLPPSLQALDEEARVELLESTATRRDALSSEIAELTRQRREHVAAELSKRDDLDSSLDKQIFDVVRSQAAAKGLHYGDMENH